MRAAMSQLNLSAGAYYRILKLARTIADMAGVKKSNPCIWRQRCTLRGRPKLMMG
jgi:predicted ATPase with chaperone activity